MTPTEVVQALIDTGTCYQIKFSSKQSNPFAQEDYSKLGYNEEEKDNENFLAWEVIDDKNELKRYQQWLLAIEKPGNFGKYIGPLLSVTVIKGKLYFQGDDVPFSNKDMVLKFACEHIRAIRMAEGTNVMLIETTFGQTGIMIPRRASIET